MFTSGLSGLYNPPPATAFKTWVAFDMATSRNRTIWAIALPADTGRFVNSALSVIFTLSFAWLWGLFAAAIIYFAPHRFSRRRLVALVALRNSADPASALIAFAGFTLDTMGCSWFRPRSRRRVVPTWQDSIFGLLLVLLALTVVISSIVMGVVGPPFLQVGNAAPVKSETLFRPRGTGYLNTNPSVYRAVLSDPAMRSLSNVEVFGDAVRNRVSIEGLENGGLAYKYNITGVEFGLKHASDFALAARGQCRLEYGWLRHSNDTVDYYEVLDDPGNTFTVWKDDAHLHSPPTATFMLKKNTKQERNVGNISYAAIATLAHRRSLTQQGDDPWYRTEALNSDGLGNETTPWRIKDRLPVLSCWHQDTWSCCGGLAVNGSMQLTDETYPLAASGVPLVLRDIIGVALLFPSVQRLGSLAGTSALQSVISTSQSIVGILDAGSSSVYKDMERLLLASFINAVNILSDTSRVTPLRLEDMNNGTYNYYLDEDTSALRPGADDFVVFTPYVQTFDLTGLIAVLCVAVFLLVIKLTLTFKLVMHTNKKDNAPTPRDIDTLDPHQDLTDYFGSPFNKDRWARFRAFSAIHLLRNAYEDGTGVPQDDWMCSEDLPEPNEKPLALVRCSRGDFSCAGHIATDPELIGGPRPPVMSGKRSRSHNNSVSTLEPLEGFQSQNETFKFPQTPPASQSHRYSASGPSGLVHREDSARSSIPLLPVHRYSNSE